MKRLISFSLWGDNPLYTNGAIANARKVSEFYPGWVCRFYVDVSTIPADTLTALRDAGAEVIDMGRTTDVLGMFWRFHPMYDDPTIERFLVRDTDSQFTHRETEMVKEWIDSGKPLHVIRDNPSHNVPILGGTWGAIPQCVKDFDIRLGWWFSRLTPCYKNPRGLFHGSDQMFLAAVVWPLFVNNHTAHILADEPKLRFTEEDIEVPAPSDGHYVGMVC